MKKTQYDKIAEQYLEVNRGPIHLYAVVPSFLAMVGDVEGLDVLDAACGSGYFTRLLSERGAREVTGIDISHRQIELAQVETRSGSIEYRTMAAADAGAAYGPVFDIVTAIFLLHYAESENHLLQMIRSLAGVLKPGGRLVAVLHNPEVEFFEEIRYRRKFRRMRHGEMANGEKLVLEIHGAHDKICEFSCHHWSKATYDSALEAGGFEDVAWIPLQVVSEGYDHQDETFWNAFKSNPHLTGLTAVRR